MSQRFTIAAGDSRLSAVDTPGGDPPLLFINGAFATLRDWRNVLARLDGKYRAIQFDARSRGKSGPSTDYSMQSAVDDVGRVIDATGVTRPILVGWSLGATIAVRYAAQHPEHVAGVVLIDGAYPITMLDENGKRKVRTQFRRLGWIMRIMAAFGRSARMTPAQSAEVVIEMDAVNGTLESDFAALHCPAIFVVATGRHSGATDEEVRRMRSAGAELAARSDRVSIFATAPSNHVQILSKSPDAVAAAIESLTAGGTIRESSVSGAARGLSAPAFHS